MTEKQCYSLVNKRLRPEHVACCSYRAVVYMTVQMAILDPANSVYASH